MYVHDNHTTTTGGLVSAKMLFLYLLRTCTIKVKTRLLNDNRNLQTHSPKNPDLSPAPYVGLPKCELPNPELYGGGASRKSRSLELEPPRAAANHNIPCTFICHANSKGEWIFPGKSVFHKSPILYGIWQGVHAKCESEHKCVRALELPLLKMSPLDFK